LIEIEKEMNEIILQNKPVKTHILKFDEAKKLGALAFLKKNTAML